MDGLLADIRQALRAFARRPGFFAVAAVTLALGIGATTAIFSVVSGVLIEPLPYRDADRIAVVRGSVPDLRDLGAGAAPAIAGVGVTASNLYLLEYAGAEETVRGDIATPGFFDVLGVGAELGRTFTAADDAQSVAILSDRLWRRGFHADRDVVGKSITLYGKAFTVVGVMPPRFRLPDEETELWVAFGASMAASPDQATNRSFHVFRGFARVAPGRTLREAQAAADVVAKRLAAEFPDTNAQTKFTLRGLRASLVGDVRPALLLLLGTVALVLLIACANVANLLLARATARAREIAVRRALGAGRLRIARQLLVESLLLALAGGALGLLLAMWGVDLLRTLAPRQIPRLDEIGLDGRVLGFAAAVSLATGVLFGLVPALDRGRVSLSVAIREGRAETPTRRGQLVRRALVVLEVAMAVVLVVGATLLGRSFVRLTHASTGVETSRMLSMNLPPIKVGADPAERTARFQQIVERVRAVPGVAAASVAIAVPPVTLQRVTGYLTETMREPDQVAWVPVSDGFFATTGAHLVAGRDVAATDAANAPPVVIVSAGLARKLFGDPGAAVGRRMKLVNQSERNGESDAWRTIVGVAGDMKLTGLADDVAETIYTPMAQTPFFWSYLLVRAAGSPGALLAPVRAAVAEAAPEQKVGSPRTLDEMLSAEVARPRFHTIMLGLFAAVALLLAAVGLYGLIAYMVVQRTREIGIRIALGARPLQVVRMVVGQGATLAGAGIVLGSVGALAASRLLSGLLYGVSATDPLSYVMVAAALVAVAVAASWLPARRAARVDPMVALRSE